MKKLSLGILSIIYLITTCGVAINIHYCMGRVSDIEYAYQDNKTCSRCGMENKDGCCHSEFKVFKLSTDQQKAKAGIDVDLQPSAVSNYFAVNLLVPVQGLAGVASLPYHSPPDKRLSAVYLHDCVFRI